MVKVIVSPLAGMDMEEIGDYISSELRNPDAALRTIRSFWKAIMPLQDFPEMGTPLLVSGKQSVPYRYLVSGSYLIFYHITAEAVCIDRVLYGRRDYMALLFGDRIENEEE